MDKEKEVLEVSDENETILKETLENLSNNKGGDE